jgi:hypothetical protein
VFPPPSGSAAAQIELSIEATDRDFGVGSVVGVDPATTVGATGTVDVVVGGAEEVVEVLWAGAAAAGLADVPHAPRNVPTAAQPSIETSLLMALRSVAE